MPTPLQSQRVGVIDLGSNTARLVVMAGVPGFNYRLEDEIREVVRLRQGMTAAGLTPDAMARAYSTLRLFKRFCDSTGVDVILPTATSAVREAANGRQFADRIRRELELPLEILSGEREAYYGVLGVLNEMTLDDGFVLDIGGGSAQISSVRNGRFQYGQALTLGALALTERFVSGDPVSDAEHDAIIAEIRRQLGDVTWLNEALAENDGPLAGLGGTIRNLAQIDAARQNYPLNTLHGYILSRQSVDDSITQFRRLPLAERRHIPGLSSDRADIILAGALVLRTVLDVLGRDQLFISLGGLREGIYLEQFWQHLPYPVIPDVRRFSVLNMARNYGYLKNHANHVRFLAGRLFVQLEPLHDYGLAERQLLDAAALLHDLGTIIDYNRHHKHSKRLIEYNGLAGFAPREIALIALLARYHRKGTPRLKRYRRLLDDADRQRLEKLSAILRLAEFLERGRNAAVDDVTVTIDDDAIRLTLIADQYPAVELWEAERNAIPLVESAFGRRVRLAAMSAPIDWPSEEPA